MQLDRFDSIDAFLRVAGPFLRTREAHHCLILGIAANLEVHPPDPQYGPPYFVTVRKNERVVLVAFQTPPWQMILSEVDDVAALQLVATDRQDLGLSAVAGPAEHVGRFARLWSEAAEVAHRLTMRERIFRLTEVVPPRPVAGAIRVAGPDDRELLTEWLVAFSRNAVVDHQMPDFQARVDRWVSHSDGRYMCVWEDDGPVSMCGVSGPTPTGIKIAPVYTPPESRGKGYASNLVASVSQRELDAGRKACFLFTDLANETANHIYKMIGYKPIRDFDRYMFG
jgi:predicted GNAT family acetyltransferase